MWEYLRAVRIGTILYFTGAFLIGSGMTFIHTLGDGLIFLGFSTMLYGGISVIWNNLRD